MLEYIYDCPQGQECLLGLKYKQPEKVIKTSRKTP